MPATWDQVNLPQFPIAALPVKADVVIVGGGITGLQAAYLLSKSNLKVAVVEKDQVGNGATGATTAFLTSYIDTQIEDLRWMLGDVKAKAVFSSHAAAIDAVAKIIQQEKIDCEFARCSNYIFASTKKDGKTLQTEQAAGQALGLDIHWRPNANWPFAKHGYLELPQQAKFHPRKYLAGLIKILQQRGVQIFEQTEIFNLNQIEAKYIFGATYAPFNKKLFFKKAFYTSYVYELSVPSGAIPAGTYEDTADPYHYFRVDTMPGHDRVIFGGEDHRFDIPVSADKNFAALKKHIASVFTDINHTFIRQWRGQILESVDGLAFIGPADASNTFYATAFSGNGMTYSAIAALMFTDFVQGKQNDWSAIYNARRIPALRSLLIKGRDYSKTLLGGAIKNSVG